MAVGKTKCLGLYVLRVGLESSEMLVEMTAVWLMFLLMHGFWVLFCSWCSSAVGVQAALAVFAFLVVSGRFLLLLASRR